MPRTLCAKNNYVLYDITDIAIAYNISNYLYLITIHNSYFDIVHFFSIIITNPVIGSSCHNNRRDANYLFDLLLDRSHFLRAHIRIHRERTRFVKSC